MKEFTQNIVIGFDYKGRRIRQRIDAELIRKNKANHTWAFHFRSGPDGFTVFGDLDTDGNPRTSGTIDENGRCCRFFVQPVSPTDNDFIDDIDIEATDIPMHSATAYITVRLDFEYEEGQDLPELKQEFVSQLNYAFDAPADLKVRLTGTEICDIDDK